MFVRYILSRVCLRLGKYSQLSFLQNMGLCVLSLPIFLTMIVRIPVLDLIIIIKSEVWPICHCLVLGHETMVCVVCLSIFLWQLSELNILAVQFLFGILPNFYFIACIQSKFPDFFNNLIFPQPILKFPDLSLAFFACSGTSLTFPWLLDTLFDIHNGQGLFVPTWWRGLPTIDGNTALGASSPAKPALHMPEPLSTTRAVTSSSHMIDRSLERKKIPVLSHWGREKMAAIFQTTFSNAFSWMKMYKFRLRFHWSLFNNFQHWFR